MTMNYRLFAIALEKKKIADSLMKLRIYQSIFFIAIGSQAKSKIKDIWESVGLDGYELSDYPSFGNKHKHKICVNILR